jgi:hypothetical protein
MIGVFRQCRDGGCRLAVTSTAQRCHISGCLGLKLKVTELPGSANRRIVKYITRTAAL